MSGSLVPSTSPSMEVGPEGGQAALQSWGPPAQPAAQAQGAMSLGRYVSALKRYKWLIAIMTLVGVAGGVVATKFITPTYQVDTTIVIGAVSYTHLTLPTSD